MAFADALQINRSKLRQKNYNKDTKRFEIARVLHKRSNETASFAERLMKKFYTSTLDEQWQVKTKKLKSGHYKFENVIYIVLYKRCNITASFEEHLKTQRKNDFHRFTLGEQLQIKIIMQNQDTMGFQYLICRKCSIQTKEAVSLLFSQSTQNFKNK